MDRNQKKRAELVAMLNEKRAAEGLPPLPAPEGPGVPRRLLGVHTIRRAPKKPGRNQPCPCGSGRKWKRCCGAPPEVRPKVIPAKAAPSMIVRPGSLLDGPGAGVADPFGDKLIVTPDDIEKLERSMRPPPKIEIAKK